MAASSSELHESADELSPAAIDRHRAIVSLMEELEAIDWYDQRVEATGNPELAAVLTHSRDEEKEHAAMTLEWLRRHDSVLDKQLRLHLFSEPASAAAEAVEDGDGGPLMEQAGGSLGIGSLKGTGGVAVNRLHRALAPISDDVWSVLDDEASTFLKHFLSARKLVDFSGPHGWDLSAGPPVGVDERVDDDGLVVRVRRALPVVEYRTTFTLSRDVITAIERDTPNPDVNALRQAARRIAEAEDSLVFDGDEAAGIPDITAASSHERISVPDDYEDYPKVAAMAVADLREAGVGGPYALALGPRCFRGVIETTHGGQVVLEHLKLIVGGPVVWSANLDGALIMSVRGGDFELMVGDDLSLGYLRHDDDGVELFVEESVTFVVHEPDAVMRLRHPPG